MTELKRTDQQITLPGFKYVAFVERHAAGRNRRIPVQHGLFHAFLMGFVRDDIAVVIDTIGDHWPAIVVAGFDQVNLVSPFGPVLHCPDLTGIRVNSQALNIAVAIAVYLGCFAVGKWVVFRHTTVFFYTHNLAEVVIGVLRFFHVFIAIT